MGTLADLCVNAKDQCSPAEDRTGYYVGLEHMATGAYRITACGRPSDVRSAKFRFRRGDVLYGKLRPYLDKAGLAERDGICSTDILVLRPKADVIPEYLLSVLHSSALRRHADATTHGVNHPRTSWAALSQFPCRKPELDEQKTVAATLMALQDAILAKAGLVNRAMDLKRSATHALFERGLTGQMQESEVGRIPASWQVERLDSCCRVVTSSLSYTDLAAMPDGDCADAVQVMGIKVSDMNAAGNEVSMNTSNLIRPMPVSEAKRHAVPPQSVVFPKRGAAIATNKKRLTTTWTILDPNLIGVGPGEGIDHRFLFQWFQRFDLRSITEPGPTPQLNKKHLVPLLVAHPATKQEQATLASLLEAFDRSVVSQARARVALQGVFQSALERFIEDQLSAGGFHADESRLIRP